MEWCLVVSQLISMSPFVGAGLVRFEPPFPILANLRIALHPLGSYVRLRLLWQMFPRLVRKLLHLLHFPHRERDSEDISSQFVYLWYVSDFGVLPLRFISILSYHFYCLIAAVCFPQTPPLRGKNFASFRIIIFDRF